MAKIILSILFEFDICFKIYNILLKKSVYAEDVAEAVHHFCLDISKKSTGNILNVDAGHVATFTR